MKILITMLAVLLACSTSTAQDRPLPLLPDKDTMLLTVFLKHDQSMNNDERSELIKATGFNDMFPPENVEIVDHYVMMGIGQVLVLRFPPDHLRAVNIAIERGAWGAYQTEFYVTYDLRAARLAQQEQ
jgi:hypothetical protein